MKIMVTGGYGFIGSYFIKHMMQLEDDVHIMNIDNLSKGSNMKNLMSHPRLENHVCDIRGFDFQLHYRDFRPDVIVHFAAESHVDRSITGPFNFVDTNVFGTFNVLETLRLEDPDRHTLLIHVSTDEVYGSLHLNQASSFHEYSPIRPNSPYAASKAASDVLVRSYHMTYGIKSIITNCSNNYGPNQDPEKFIPTAIIALIEGRKIPVYGKGINVRDWLYVQDHCGALRLLINKGVIGERYNIGPDYIKELNNLDIVKKIVKAFGLDGPVEDYYEFVEDRAGHDLKYKVDSSKIKNLGWLPYTAFDHGLEYTVGWYKNNKEWWTSNE